MPLAARRLSAVRRFFLWRPGGPPSDAVVLFDGSDLSRWVISGKRDERGKPVSAGWKR